MIKKLKKFFLFLILISAIFLISGTIFNSFNKNQNIYLKEIKKTSKKITNIDDVKTLDELNSIEPSEIAKWSNYDGRNFNIIPKRVDDQSTLPLCWAYAIASATEISILKSKIGNYSYNDNLFNLDEKNIDYITNIRTSEADKLGLTLYDRQNKVLKKGNFPAIAALAATQQNGLVLVSENKSNSYGKPIAFLKNIINIEDRYANDVNLIKRLIAKYGSVIVVYDSHGQDAVKTCFNSKNKSRWSNAPHAVTIIGWNDKISKNSFERNASIDGAWIVRNSWGVYAGEGGYFNLSYDSPLSDIVTLDYEPIKKEYENQYYYDGLSESSYNGKNKAAAIFPVKKASYDKKEKIKAVRVGVKGNNVEVTTKIYTNVSANEFDRFSPENDPTNGTLISTKNNTYELPGFYTIDLDQEIEIQNGEYFSVVIEVSNKNNDAAISFSYEPHSLNDMTYYLKNNKWVNCFTHGNYVARIRALTTTEHITNSSSNNDLKWSTILLEDKNYDYSNIYRYNDKIKPKAVVKFDNKILIENQDYKIKEELKLNLLKTTNSENDLIGYSIIHIIGVGKYKGNNKIHYPIRVALIPDLQNFGNVNLKNKTITITIDSSIEKYKDITLPNGWSWVDNLDKKIHENAYIRYDDDDKNCYKINLLNVILKKNNKIINKQNISDAVIKINEDDIKYTSYKIKPDVDVILKNEKLTKGIDYLVSYNHNINSSEQAIIIITGINNFKGTKNAIFKINKADNLINNFKIDYKTKQLSAKAKFGQVQFLYFSDSKCKNKLSYVPENYGTYYVKAVVEDSDNWNYVESPILELKISDNDIFLKFIDEDEKHDNYNLPYVNKKIKRNNKLNTILWITIPLILFWIVSGAVVILLLKKRKNQIKQ